ncbi:MAG TPA: hypothetical protein VK420_00940, partial [Longimicrobium sp.]|nr:hypothetical protein [Longimicrobium sp.]
MAHVEKPSHDRNQQQRGPQQHLAAGEAVLEGECVRGAEAERRVQVDHEGGRRGEELPRRTVPPGAQREGVVVAKSTLLLLVRVFSRWCASADDTNLISHRERDGNGKTRRNVGASSPVSLFRPRICVMLQKGSAAA